MSSRRSLPPCVRDFLLSCSLSRLILHVSILHSPVSSLQSPVSATRWTGVSQETGDLPRWQPTGTIVRTPIVGCSMQMDETHQPRHLSDKGRCSLPTARIIFRGCVCLRPKSLGAGNQRDWIGLSPRPNSGNYGPCLAVLTTAPLVCGDFA